MKYLILLIGILSSCNIKHNNSSVISQTNSQSSFFNELLHNDFLIYTDSSKIDSVRQSFISDENIFSQDVNRYFHVDAEELAEGSFNHFKNDLTKILQKRGLEMTFSTTQNWEKLHEIMINNKKLILYDDNNLADYSFWEVGAKRFFNALNQELEFNNSKERFYLMYGGNDLGAILLTEKQYDIIAKIYKGNERDIPYKP